MGEEHLGDDDSLTLDDYAEAVLGAVGARRDLVVVGQSFGAFTAPLVSARRPVGALVLVLVAGMVPAPGFLRRLVRERLGVVPEEIAAGHCVALGHPAELAAVLTGAETGGPG
ncbi:hypothetical protein [Streptomyces sp. WAC06614]|uniref:hypothetical protein n=1 Tax=Streptomyces sp. WAC06614 TaxID=2487416 RepID=UPI000F777430|nr:hypothetical protein [Streptomyces sp. WAC06614]RSS82928.1 hypothetical protein EF918_05270 [Streptomyces sp. WAC06614]